MELRLTRDENYVTFIAQLGISPLLRDQQSRWITHNGEAVQPTFFLEEVKANSSWKAAELWGKEGYCVHYLRKRITENVLLLHIIILSNLSP